MPNGLLSSVNNIVVLMLENRSFDHMLGFLYANSGNVSPTGDPFEGLPALAHSHNQRLKVDRASRGASLSSLVANAPSFVQMSGWRISVAAPDDAARLRGDDCRFDALRN